MTRDVVKEFDPSWPLNLNQMVARDFDFSNSNQRDIMVDRWGLRDKMEAARRK